MPAGDGTPPEAEGVPAGAPVLPPLPNALMPPIGRPSMLPEPPFSPGDAAFDELQPTEIAPTKRSTVAR
jgi:hypothetical protein